MFSSATKMMRVRKPVKTGYSRKFNVAPKAAAALLPALVASGRRD
jgi:hypothetical protein